MESTENGVQAEKKEATKDDSEQVKAEVAPAEKVEKVEKTEEKAEKAEEKAEKAEKTEEKAEKPPQKAEEPEKEKVEEKKVEEVKKEEEKKVEEVKKEEEKKVEEVKKEEEKKVEEVKKEEEKKVEEVKKEEEKKVEEVKKEEEKVEEKTEETKKSDEKVEEVKETETVEEEEEEEEVVEEVEDEEESKEKEEKTETVEKDESSKAKEESEPTEKEGTKEPQEEVGSGPEPKPESDSGSDEELIIEEEEVDEDEDEEETKEVVIIRRPAAKDTEKKEAAEPKKEVAVTNGEAEEEEVEALTVKLHSKVKVEDEKTEPAEPERKEESPKKVAEPEPAFKAEPKEEAPVREQPTYEPPPRQEYSPRPQGYYSYENRDVPQVKRDFSQYDRDVPRVERDYPPHIYTGHKYSYLDRETPRVQREEPPRVLREEPPRVQREEPPRVLREEPPRVQREEPTRFRQEFPSQFQAPSYTQWPPSKQSHVSYETEEIRETVRETSGAGPMRREVYDERLVRQEYKSRDGSSQGPKQVDLQKIFTPATDTEEIIPKNRKLYASSAFYSPGLHPTVEDQVELARKISHSLSDSNNQQSKGQSMYVNRKKRSVKWVHEGEGTATIAHEYNEESKENNFENRVSSRSFEKVPLKLVMDPRGQVKTPSFNDYNIDAGMQSPEICADIMKSLHAPKGKGAELFAKRRKKSENWIVDETNTSNSSSQGLHETTYGQATGIPSTGPQEYSSYDQYQYSQSPYAAQKTLPKSEQYEKVSSYTTKTESSSVYSATRDLAYKPSIPRGWNAPAPSLPKNLYTPPGIPLDSYAPPPEVSVPSPTQPSWAASSSLHTSQSPYYPSPSSYTAEPVSSEPTYSSPTKQPGYYSPSKSPYSPSLAQGYKRPQPTGGSFSPPQSNVQHATPSINFNPSPLPYEKLEKFDRPSTPPSYTPYTYRGTKSPVVSSFPKSQPTYKPQPKYEQPKYEAPKYETPNYETPKYEPPKYEQPPKYEPYQSETQLSPPISRNGYSTTLTYPSKSPVYPSFPSEIPLCSRVSPGEVMRGPTFNTAPRGWNQMRDYYRPVTLDDPKQYAHMSYTDF